MPSTKSASDLDASTDAVLAASRVLVAVAARSLAEHEEEVSIPQFRSLVILYSRGPQRPVDLATALGVDPSTVTRLCDRLVRKGLISRRRRGADRRAVQLALSARGTELVSTVTRRRQLEIRRILRAVPPSSRRRLACAFELFSAAAAGDTAQADQIWEL